MGYRGRKVEYSAREVEYSAQQRLVRSGRSTNLVSKATPLGHGAGRRGARERVTQEGAHRAGPNRNRGWVQAGGWAAG